MSTTPIDGVTAGGHVPTWIIPASLITEQPSGDGPWSIPLSALTDPTTIKIDCYMDAGDVTVTRTANTTPKQRLCETVVRNVKTSETIDATIAGVYDQQQAMTEVVNLAYAALPEGADVYIAQAFAHDQSVAPTTATVVDLIRGEVQMRMKTQPTAADEDLKFSATISAAGLWSDVTLTAAV